MNMNVKHIFKLSFLLITVMVFTSFAQEGTDWRNQDIKMSFRDKRIDGYRFDNARAVKNVTDFQRSTGEKPSSLVQT